jgi:transposase
VDFIQTQAGFVSEIGESRSGQGDLFPRNARLFAPFSAPIVRPSNRVMDQVARSCCALRLDWHTVKTLDQQYMQAQLARAGGPGPQVIGIDEIAIRKGHTYRIVVSDLLRRRPIWFGGKDRSEASMSEFYVWLGAKKSGRIRLAVMDMWRPFRLATAAHAPNAAILFDKFHVIRGLQHEVASVVCNKEITQLVEC